MSDQGEPTARDAILSAVRAARPPAVARPSPREKFVAPSTGEPSLLDAFVAAATAGGAQVVVGSNGDVARLALGAGAEPRQVLSAVAEVGSTIAMPTDPHALATLDHFVCEADLGVAENGAVWIAPENSVHRAALFLATRVTIVVPASSIVPTLHEAYERIDLRARTFGVFVAGPSKTADIEQSLVVGAHGPKELTMIVTSPH